MLHNESFERQACIRTGPADQSRHFLTIAAEAERTRERLKGLDLMDPLEGVGLVALVGCLGPLGGEDARVRCLMGPGLPESWPTLTVLRRKGDHLRGCISVSRKAWSALSAQECDARAAVAFGIGCLVLHHREILRLQDTTWEDRRWRQHWTDNRLWDHPRIEDLNWQADVFARCLLVPMRGLEALDTAGNLDVRPVANAYKVTDELARQQIAQYRKHRRHIRARTARELAERQREWQRWQDLAAQAITAPAEAA